MSDKIPLKKRIAFVLIPVIFRFFFILVGTSCRQVWVGREHIEKLKEENQSWIYSLWHNNTAIAYWVLKNSNLVALVSSSKDGEFISRAMESMGNTTIRGSSSRGGIKALLQMIKALKKGQLGAITPDGPRGPKYILQNGTITLAQKAGVPLVPLHIEVTRQWVFEKSWDMHKLPKPFATILIKVGKPYWVPASLNEEAFDQVRKDFENIMIENQKECGILIDKLRNKNEI